MGWWQSGTPAIAAQANTQGQPLPRLYQHYQLRWESLGYPAFIAMAGRPRSTPGRAIAIARNLVAGACWLPVVWPQLRMRDMAAQAAQSEQGDGVLPPLYWRYARWWEALGYPAFVAMAVVFYLMVNKPALAF